MGTSESASPRLSARRRLPRALAGVAALAVLGLAAPAPAHADQGDTVTVQTLTATQDGTSTTVEATGTVSSVAAGTKISPYIRRDGNCKVTVNFYSRGAFFADAETTVPCGESDAAWTVSVTTQEQVCYSLSASAALYRDIFVLQDPDDPNRNESTADGRLEVQKPC